MTQKFPFFYGVVRYGWPEKHSKSQLLVENGIEDWRHVLLINMNILWDLELTSGIIANVFHGKGCSKKCIQNWCAFERDVVTVSFGAGTAFILS